MTDLTDEELRAELERRQRPVLPRPCHVRDPDWEPLIKMMEESLTESIAKGYEDDDFKHYVYEMAITAVYGKEYFQWRNAQRW